MFKTVCEFLSKTEDRLSFERDITKNKTIDFSTSLVPSLYVGLTIYCKFRRGDHSPMVDFSAKVLGLGFHIHFYDNRLLKS